MSLLEAHRPTHPVGPGFIAAYTLAQVGSFISFVPLFQVMVPLKAAEIDPAHKTVVLSAVVFYGALMAGGANLLAGFLSDRTTSRFGRRRPWIVFGGVGVLLSYGCIYAAHSTAALLFGVALFQLLFNFLFAAVVAVVADRVPDLQKGRVAALASVGYPLGTLAGLVIVGVLFRDEGPRFLALGVVVVAAMAPLLFGLDDPPQPKRDVPQGGWLALARTLWVDPRRNPDFTLAWSGRFLVIIGFSLVQGYMLFFLQDAMHYSRVFAGHPAEEGLTALTAVWSAANIIAALAGGLLSDRLKRRKLFVALGGIMLAAAMLGFAMAPDWRTLIGAYLVYGCGAGVYYAVDLALIAQVLPALRDVGKDLGIVNLSNTLPQAIAPMLAVWLMGAVHTDFRGLFVVAAGLCGVGGLLVLPIRGVK